MTDGLTVLGSSVREPIDHVEVFAAPAHVTAVRLTTDEVASLCPVTSQPDLSTVEIDYVPTAGASRPRASSCTSGGSASAGVRRGLGGRDRWRDHDLARSPLTLTWKVSEVVPGAKVSVLTVLT